MAMATMHVLLSPVDLSVGEVVYAPDGQLGPRRQRDVELVLVHAGHADVSVDGEPPWRIAAGSIGLLLPGHIERFAFSSGEPTRHSWVQGRASDPGRLADLPRVLPASSALSTLMHAAVTAGRESLPTAREVTAALASAAVWRYVGEAESCLAGPSDPVERARGFIHARTADPEIDLRAIAAAAHVTPAHLVRRFRVELGTTPAAYLWEQRVTIGIDLLTHTGLPVGEIASRAGFRSVYHFSRRVKRHTGASPTQIRQQRWLGA
jgi:AraC family transcriptional regulator of arabinose operon